jgi:DNA-binding CsgD family transcriptional regulator
VISLTDTDRTALAALTHREREVLVCMAQGRQDEQIGVCLGITRSTVNGYLKKIFDRLGVRTRVSAAVIATKAGWV